MVTTFVFPWLVSPSFLSFLSIDAPPYLLLLPLKKNLPSFLILKKLVFHSGYPEGHIESEDKEIDLPYLKEKLDAGADYVVTQLFYDADLFIDWVRKIRAMGITAPILPGIMPIQSYGGFKRMTSLCKTKVPQFIMNDLEPIKVRISLTGLGQDLFLVYFFIFTFNPLGSLTE